MKFVRGAAAVALAFTLQAPAALADDGCCGPLGPAGPAGSNGPVVQIDDDDSTDMQVIRELEARLNEVLIVEESGRIVLREEFKEGLPIPADRVQMMLGSFVELGPDGKIKIRNPEQVKPYLPMIQRFLSPESMEQLRELQKLPPEQRREAMQRMFGRGGQAQPAPTPAPQPRPAAPKPEAKPAPAPRGEEEGWDDDGDEDEGHLHTRPERDGHFHREPRADHEHGDDDGAHEHGRTAPPARAGDLDQRMAQLEHRLERLERALREGQGRHPEADAPRGERRGMLDLFGRGRERRDVFGDLGRRAEVWRGGLKKLSEIMQPEDFQRLGRTMDRLRGQLGSGDLRDRGKLMEKVQESVDPQDIGRFMEIFSEFIGSPEGREFVAEIERVIERLEQLVNSEQGQRLGDALERLGGGEGDLRERMDQLMRGRDARPRGEGQREEGRREQPRRQRQPRVPEGAKLY